MKTTIALFLSSLVLILLLTPLVRRFGARYGIVDLPSDRKVHTLPIPRIGGVAVYFSFLLPFVGFLFYSDPWVGKFLSGSVFWVFGGATLVFLLGLFDDIFRLRPGIKFAVQIVAALMAYQGGARILVVTLPWVPAMWLGWLCVPVTVFWYLLVVNAINLIDGLDGLAVGICLFVSFTLLCLGLMKNDYFISIGLAGLVGVSLGFLFFNFNPASIFLGDSGSYFLGFMIASLSILGSVKSQATVAILIPVVALGVPLFDTILAPIRRFVLGHDAFSPDKGHIHHKLLSLGLTHRKVVLIMYASTLFCGFCAMLLVYVRNEQACLILLSLGIFIFFFVKKIGYLKHLAANAFIRYLQDIMEAMGVNKDRRKFLNCQVCIGWSESYDQLWHYIVDAIKHLNIDSAELELNHCPTNGHYSWKANGTCDSNNNGCELFSLQLPLRTDSTNYGTLHLSKDLAKQPIKRYTLRRIEHLKWDIVRQLKELENSKDSILS